jgi:hypothetical protein
MASREEIFGEVSQMLGAVPGWINGIPDPQLEHQWGLIKWLLSDTALSAREKALAAFGAAEAVHCPY